MEGNQSTMNRLRRKEERSKNRAQRQVQLLGQQAGERHTSPPHTLRFGAARVLARVYFFLVVAARFDRIPEPRVRSSARNTPNFGHENATAPLR